MNRTSLIVRIHKNIISIRTKNSNASEINTIIVKNNSEGNYS